MLEDRKAPFEAGNAEAPTVFSALLLPHRSLPRKGFLALMAGVCIVSFVSGVAFTIMGAWPVTGFFGLDVLLMYIAFRANYRSARLFERVDLTETELKVTRVPAAGNPQSWVFNPYWVRFEITKRKNATAELSLSSHGRRLIFGAFLADSEREKFAAAFSTALAAGRH